MASSPTRRHVNVEHGRLRMCVSQKVGFPTKSQALDACERMMEAGFCEPGCHITPYRCYECSDWHVYNRRIVQAR